MQVNSEAVLSAALAEVEKLSQAVPVGKYVDLVEANSWIHQLCGLEHNFKWIVRDLVGILIDEVATGVRLNGHREGD